MWSPNSASTTRQSGLLALWRRVRAWTKVHDRETGDSVMIVRRRVVASAVLVGSLVLPGCSHPLASALAGKCVLAKGFELDLASATGGQPNPVAAAARTRVPGFSIPSNGWRVSVARGSSNGEYLRSGDTQVLAVEGPDGTWQVVSGGRCRVTH